MKEKHVKLSRFLSFILRHKPETVGLTLDNQGYAKVDELIEGINKSKHEINEEILSELIETDNKQRYSYNDKKDKVRANQGHSIKVNLGLQEKTPPDVLFHGTGVKFIDSIKKGGLKSKGRHHVHLSSEYETAIEVGKRHGSPVVIKIDCKQMAKDGHTFYLSSNNVWLVDKVPSKYFI